MFPLHKKVTGCLLFSGVTMNGRYVRVSVRQFVTRRDRLNSEGFILEVR